MSTEMNRRHFLKHVAGFSAMALPGMQFFQGLRAAEDKLKKANKSLVIFWMGGGPSHMDLWDLKPGAQTGGEFKPIKTRPPASRSAKCCRPSPASSTSSSHRPLAGDQ